MRRDERKLRDGDSKLERQQIYSTGKVSIKWNISASTLERDARGGVCASKLCRFYDTSVPYLFVAEHSDGYGHRMQNILDGLAVASKNGMNFGGVIPSGSVGGPRQRFRLILNMFFGGGTSRDIFRHPNCDVKFASPQLLESNRPNLSNHSLVYLPSLDSWERTKSPTTAYYTPELKNTLRRNLDTLPLVYAAKRPRVGIHVRRGDLPKNDGRILPDAYFVSLVARIRHILKDADVHIWSSIENPTGANYWNSADFDTFRKQKINVHLNNTPNVVQYNSTDTQDVVSIWAHLARADIFILSHSSFSYVPAVLNAGCVIHPGMSPALVGWVDGMKATSTQLEECLMRAVGRKTSSAVAS